MPIIPKPEFLSNIRESGIVEETKLVQWLDANDHDDCATLARAMARDQLLTLWQAKYLLSGRTKLHLGSYRLLERISRGNLGDRFLAIHLQLDRKVEIQVLPIELATSLRLRDQFLEKASVAATLDHPNLVHVYDIDRESGRYILVCEHIEGQPLSKIAPETLSDVKVANLVQQALAGIKFACDHNVIHGEVTADSITVTPAFQAKIQHIALAGLEKQLLGGTVITNTQPDKDIATIAGLGLKLLEKTPAESPDRLSLVAALETTQAEPSVESLPLSLGVLEEWIKENDLSDPELVATLDAGGQLAVPAAIPFVLPAMESDVPLVAQGLPTSPEVAPPLQAVPQPVSPPPAKEKPPVAKKSKSWVQKNPGMVIGIAAGLAFLILGGTIALAYNLVTREPKVVESTPPVRTVKKEETAQPKPEKKKPKIADKLDPEEVKKSLAAIRGEAPEDPIAPVVENDPKPPANPPAVTPNNPASTAANTPNAKPPTDAAMAEPPKTTDPPTTSDPPKTAVTPAPKKTTPKPKVNVKHEFEKTARSVQLPDATDSAETHVADVHLPDNALLGAELLSTPMISKAKNLFEMARSPNDKQLWIVSWKGKPNAPAVDVAQFKRVDTKVSFKWLPAASENENANYLRNCKLKLMGPKRKHWVDLRQPITITGLALSEDSHEVELETDVAWLPHPDAMQIEVFPFKVDGDFVVLNPAIVAKKTPARVFFTNDEAKQYFWLQVDADAKKKLKLELSLQLLVKGRPKVAKMKMIAGFASQLKYVADSQQAAYAQIKDKKTPDKYKGGFEAWKKFKGKVEQESRRSLENATAAIRYEQMIPKLYASGIPIVVKFKGEGGAETILAKTEFDESLLKK